MGQPEDRVTDPDIVMPVSYAATAPNFLPNKPTLQSPLNWSKFSKPPVSPLLQIQDLSRINSIIYSDHATASNNILIKWQVFVLALLHLFEYLNE